MEFDTDKEERQGAWVVLAMFAVAAAVPPVACLWILRKLESTDPTSLMGVGPFLGGLTIAGIAAIALGFIGAVLVVYGLVRVNLHGPFYVLGGLLTTTMALSPILMGWNTIDEIPSVEDFDPGDCSSCGDDGACVQPWPALGSRIPALGECRGGRREGEWVFGRPNERRLASFTFEAGLRHGPFETDAVRGSFRDDLRDGEWAWFRSGRIFARGQYVVGQADGRWACLDEDSTDELELLWVLFDRGRVVEGTADVYAGGSIVASSDAEGELAAEGIFCEPPGGPAPIDHFERMVLAEPQTRPENQD